MAYRTVGKSLPRVEGSGKVTGQTKYAADLAFDGLLWAKVLRSSVPHARIVNIDASKAKALKGVRAVLTGADVKDIYVGTRVKDQPVLAYDKVRMSGDAVAVVGLTEGVFVSRPVRVIDLREPNELRGCQPILDPLRGGCGRRVRDFERHSYLVRGGVGAARLLRFSPVDTHYSP